MLAQQPFSLSLEGRPLPRVPLPLLKFPFRFTALSAISNHLVYVRACPRPHVDCPTSPIVAAALWTSAEQFEQLFSPQGANHTLSQFSAATDAELARACNFCPALETEFSG
jgi:hypothetical protein